MKAKKNNKPDISKEKLIEDLQLHQAELEAQKTELDVALQEVQTALDRYSDLYDFSPVTVLSVDPKYRIVECNIASGEMLGYPRTDLINKDLRLFILPKFHYAFGEFIKQIFVSAKKHYLELEVVGKNRKPIFCQLVGLASNPGPNQLKQCRVALTDISALKHEQEVIKKLNTELIGINQGLEHEITRRKEVEVSLSESREKYAGLFANMTDGFAYNKIFFNQKGEPVDYITLEVNKAFESVTGLKPDMVIGRKITEALPLIEKELDVWINDYGRAILSGKKIRFETFVSALGRWLSVSAYSPGKGYFALILQDITQRKKAEEELRRANEMLEAVTTGTKVLISTLDKDFRFTYFNREHQKELKRLTGKKTRIGMSLKEVFAKMPDQLKVALNLWGRPLNGETVDQTTEFGDSARYRRIYQTQYTPLRDNQGNIIGAGEVSYDITDQKRAELALRESETKLKVAIATEKERKRLYDVLETLPVYVILLSKDYHVRFANKFFRERFGESHGKCCYEYLFHRTEPCENCETYKVLKTNKNHHWEWTGPDKRNYDIYDYPFTDEGGARMILEMGIDITERMQAEAAVLSERKRLFEVLETLPAMICLLTRDYHVAFANRAFRQKFGEAKGRHCYEYCYGKSQPCDFCQSYKVLETGKPHHWEVTTEDGTVIDASDFPFTDMDGSRMILEMDVDITEVRQAQIALKKAHDELEIKVAERTKELLESRESFSRIVHTSNEGIIVYALDGKIDFANNRMAEMFGFSDPEELAGKIPLEEFVEPDDKPLILKTREELNRGSNLQVEFRFHRKDGSIFWVNSSAAPLIDEQGNHFANLAMYTDITERKKIEEILKQSNEELQRLNQTMVGRELRMIELKKEINDLLAKINNPPRYPLDFEKEGNQENV